jgi:hypothetical protein
MNLGPCTSACTTRPYNWPPPLPYTSAFRFSAAEAYAMHKFGLVLLLSACLFGCGQKGPLYLPDGQASSAQPAPR